MESPSYSVSCPGSYSRAQKDIKASERGKGHPLLATEAKSTEKQEERNYSSRPLFHRSPLFPPFFLFFLRRKRRAQTERTNTSRELVSPSSPCQGPCHEDKFFCANSWSSPPRYNYPRFAVVATPSIPIVPRRTTTVAHFFPYPFRRALLEFNLPATRSDRANLVPTVSPNESRVLRCWPPFVPAFFDSPFVSPSSSRTRESEKKKKRRGREEKEGKTRG